MKKFINFILFIFVIGVIFPAVPASAAVIKEKTDVKSAVPAPEVQQVKPLLGKESLEKVIALVKSRIQIPVNYTQFNSDVYDNVGKTAFRLRWSTADNNYTYENGSIEVTVDENGIVSNYYSYYNDKNYDSNRRLPEITTEQAAARARKFIADMCPDIAGKLSYDTALERSTIEYDGSISLNFYRIVDGIPFYDSNVYVQVDGQNGQVRSMYRSWDDSLVFARADKAISQDKAQAAWKKEIGLKLRYKIIWSQNGVKPMLRYSPSTADMLSAIDGLTGAKTVVSNMYNPYSDSGYRPDRYYGSISDSELDEIKQLKNLIDSGKGEKLVRNMPELGIDDTYKLSSYAYNRMGSDSYNLQLDFLKAFSKDSFPKDIPPEKLKVMIAAGEGGGYASVTLDALTSELLTFTSSGNSTAAPSNKMLSGKELQKSAEAFLGKYKNSRFRQVELTGNSPVSNDYMMKYGVAGPAGSGSFVYNRKVNGILVEDNGLSVNLDAATGRITSFSEVWDDVPFPAANGIISLDKAYEELFRQNELELRYAAALNIPVTKEAALLNSTNTAVPELKPVYSLGNNKPVIIDAVKGVLINGSTGEEFIDRNISSYDDLAGNPHKTEIEKMMKSGLLPLTKSFRPNDPMLQKDFLILVALLRGSGISGLAAGSMTQTDMDGMYRQLINEGMITEEERAPDEVMTKAAAVKFLLRAIGYGKFAEMKGIFDCKYTDKAIIAPEMLGYAAIAGSLGIVEGTAFEPGKKLTRMDAAMMIYRYVSR